MSYSWICLLEGNTILSNLFPSYDDGKIGRWRFPQDLPVAEWLRPIHLSLFSGISSGTQPQMGILQIPRPEGLLGSWETPSLLLESTSTKASGCAVTSKGELKKLPWSSSDWGWGGGFNVLSLTEQASKMEINVLTVVNVLDPSESTTAEEK